PVLPFVLLTLGALTNPGQGAASRRWYVPMTATGILVVIGFGVVSILFAHDQSIWNRVRGQAVTYLVREKGIDPSAIDGGLSVNGWYLFPSDERLRKRYINWHFEPGTWWRND